MCVHANTIHTARKGQEVLPWHKMVVMIQTEHFDRGMELLNHVGHLNDSSCERHQYSSVMKAFQGNTLHFLVSEAQS